jgi:2-dehydropantoate 2-reductase
MRGAAGDIAAAGAGDLALSLADECAGIAADNGFAPSDAALANTRTMLTAPGSEFVASMLRDVERGAATEADHILGDLLSRRAEGGDPQSLLRIAYAHLKVYEARRAREAAAQASPSKS